MGRRGSSRHRKRAAGKRAWYGVFPQLGAPVGFVLSGGVFLLLSKALTNNQFFAFGWRIPFLSSAVLVLVGLRPNDDYGDPCLPRSLKSKPTSASAAVGSFAGPLSRLVGTMVSLATFVLFYLMTVLTLSWGTTALGCDRKHLVVNCLRCCSSHWPGRCLVGGTRPPSDTHLGYVGHRWLWPRHGANVSVRKAGTCLALGLSLMGLTYGPLGTVLSELSD